MSIRTGIITLTIIMSAATSWAYTEVPQVRNPVLQKEANTHQESATAVHTEQQNAVQEIMLGGESGVMDPSDPRQVLFE